MTTIHEDFTRAVGIKRSSDRLFGFVFAAAFVVVACVPLVHGHRIRVWALVVSGLFLAAGAFRPALVSPLNRVWFRFGRLMHQVVSSVVLGTTFFVVLTPTGWLLRLTGKDALRLRRVTERDTYWIGREPPGPTPKSMAHQF
jgi:hypothetical protein